MFALHISWSMPFLEQRNPRSALSLYQSEIVSTCVSLFATNGSLTCKRVPGSTPGGTTISIVFPPGPWNRIVDPGEAPAGTFTCIVVSRDGSPPVREEEEDAFFVGRSSCIQEPGCSAGAGATFPLRRLRSPAAASSFL